MPVFKVKEKFVSVPLEFITDHMTGAHGEYVKVYLYGLAAAAEGREADNETIAESLHILVTDVEKAWRYWNDRGLLKVTDEGIEYGGEEQEKFRPEENRSDDRPPHISARDIATALKLDPGMKDTISMVEQLMNKPLTQREITCIFNFMDWYGMDRNLVLMLFEYCISMDKRSFAYIEKVAQSWNRDGINDIKSAEAVIKRANAEKKFQGRCRKLFGIDRAFTPSELKYINSWKSEMNFSINMIEQAYDITIKNTGKLAFAYMNKILTSWHQKGIKTPEKIQERDQRPRDNGTKIDEIELIEMRRRIQRDNGN